MNSFSKVDTKAGPRFVVKVATVSRLTNANRFVAISRAWHIFSPSAFTVADAQIPTQKCHLAPIFMSVTCLSPYNKRLRVVPTAKIVTIRRVFGWQSSQRFRYVSHVWFEFHFIFRIAPVCYPLLSTMTTATTTHVDLREIISKVLHIKWVNFIWTQFVSYGTDTHRQPSVVPSYRSHPVYSVNLFVLFLDVKCCVCLVCSAHLCVSVFGWK